MLTLPHLGIIERNDPRLGETIRSIQNAINQHGTVSGVDPTAVYPTPDAPSSLSVTAANGFFDAVITDANPVRGVEYWLEWSTEASFSTATTRQIHLVASRNWYGQLGNMTLYWRCFSQFPGSNPSGFTYFGTSAKPTAVVGGGAAGPAPQASSGSGAGTTRGTTPFPPVGVGRGPLAISPVARNLPGGRLSQS